MTELESMKAVTLLFVIPTFIFFLLEFTQERIEWGWVLIWFLCIIMIGVILGSL